MKSTNLQNSITYVTMQINYDFQTRVSESPHINKSKNYKVTRPSSNKDFDDNSFFESELSI